MNKEIHNNNFDVMRLIASVLVVYSHAFVLHGLNEPLFLGFTSLGGLGVDIFFSMSGYLVVQSWLSDQNLLRFLMKRSLRIFPALFAVVALSTFLLGPLMTTLSINDYFMHPFVLKYLENAYLGINYTLPGVFYTNPYPVAVNGCLWSLPIEFLMYVIVMVFGIIKIVRAKWTFIISIIVFFSIGQYIRINNFDVIVFARMDIRQIFFVGGYFFAGAALFIFKDFIRFSISNVIFVSVLGLVLSGTQWIHYWGVIGMPYIVIAICVQNEKWLRIPKSVGDLSYGIYLYGFPIQQTVEYFLHEKINVLQAFGLEIAITALFAYCSWHVLEKQALKLKPRRSEDRRPVPLTATNTAS